MADDLPIREGQILIGSLFNEPMRVETVRSNGPEFELYRDITRFVKQQSAKAAAQGEDPRARAIGFLMSLYQRRLASSTYAMRHSLNNRVRRLTEGLKRAQELCRLSPADLCR